MKRTTIFRAALVVATSAAFCATAQQQSATPTEQALGKRLMAEINAGLICDSSLIGAQAQISDLTRQVNDLKTQLAAAKGESPPK